MAFREGRKPKVCQIANYTPGVGIRGCTLNYGHKPPCKFDPIECNNGIFCPAEFHDPWCERYIADRMADCENPDCDDCVDQVAEPCDFDDEEQPPMTEEYEIHNTAGGLTSRCTWRDYQKGGRTRCVLKADHDGHHQLVLGPVGKLIDTAETTVTAGGFVNRPGELKTTLCKGDCGDIDCPDCIDAEGNSEEAEKLVRPHEKDFGTSLHYVLEDMNRQSHRPAPAPLGAQMGGALSRAHVGHYADSEIETIDFIYDKLGTDGGHDYVLGNIMKYASRAKHKGQFASDIEKIRNYAVIMQEQERKRK